MLQPIWPTLYSPHPRSWPIETDLRMFLASFFQNFCIVWLLCRSQHLAYDGITDHQPVYSEFHLLHHRIHELAGQFILSWHHQLIGFFCDCSVLDFPIFRNPFNLILQKPKLIKNLMNFFGSFPISLTVLFQFSFNSFLFKLFNCLKSSPGHRCVCIWASKTLSARFSLLIMKADYVSWLCSAQTYI